MCKREYIVNIIICLLRGCRQVSNNNLLINYCYIPNTIFCQVSKDSDNKSINSKIVHAATISLFSVIYRFSGIGIFLNSAFHKLYIFFIAERNNNLG